VTRYCRGSRSAATEVILLRASSAIRTAVYASASVLAKSDDRGPARNRMRELLSDLPDVVPDNLDDLRHNGWLAVIHGRWQRRRPDLHHVRGVRAAGRQDGGDS